MESTIIKFGEAVSSHIYKFGYWMPLAEGIIVAIIILGIRYFIDHRKGQILDRRYYFKLFCRIVFYYYLIMILINAQVERTASMCPW